MNDLILTKELNGLTESKAAQIKAVFQPMVEMLDSFESAYHKVESMEQSEEKSAAAKRLRLSIARTKSEFDELLLRAKNKKKWHEEEQAAIKIENEKLKAEKEKMEAERAAREAELQKERAAREAELQKERAAREAKEEKQAKEKRRFELAPDKEKLLNFAGMLYSGRDGIKSAEAKKALSQAINTLSEAASKMEDGGKNEDE